jgi:flagellar FliL protein
MLAKLLPVMLALAGLSAGLGAGVMMRAPETAAAETTDPATEGEEAAAESAEAAADPKAGGSHSDEAGTGSGEAAASPDFVRFTNQFVVPLIERGRVASMVVIALGVEVSEGQEERVYALEPKLRDGLLRVMFDHANAGGFDGSFTEAAALEPLRTALREAAIRIYGPDLKDVLISEIVRQDN